MFSRRILSREATTLCVLLVAAPTAVAAIQDVATGDPSIIPSDTRVELLFDGAYATEGPAVGPDRFVYFSDITNTVRTNMQAGHIWRYDPRTGGTELFRSPSGMANGIIFDQEGRMVVAEGADFGGRRVTRTDMVTGKAVILAGLYEGRAFNAPNDLAIDEAGRIYFTDPRYSGHEPVEQPVRGVYRIDPDGTITLIISDVVMPNGILVAPDQRTLYVASILRGDTTPRANALLAYDLASDGSVRFRETIIDFSPEHGVDGMAIDVDGNLYVGRPVEPWGVYIYGPDGLPKGHIPTPDPVRNVAFGRGEDANRLYITGGGSLYHVQIRSSGYHATRW